MNSKNTILIRLGDRLRRIRQNKSLSQEELAHLAEFDRTYISLIERGKRNASYLNLVKLARALNVSPQNLFEDIW